jgi:hypothetical protein
MKVPTEDRILPKVPTSRARPWNGRLSAHGWQITNQLNETLVTGSLRARQLSSEIEMERKHADATESGLPPRRSRKHFPFLHPATVRIN